MRLLALAVLPVLAALQEPNGLTEFHLKNVNPTFEITLPAGYRKVPSREVPLTYERKIGRESWEMVRLEIVPLGRALSQGAAPRPEDPLSALKLTDVRDRKPYKARWQEFEVDGLECRHTSAGMDAAALAAWVPLEPESISVCVSVPSTLAKELPGDLRRLLDSLKGSTAWLTDRDRRILALYRWPAFAVPVLSALFLAAWVAVFRGRPMQAHAVRLAWHVVVVATTLAAFAALQQSGTARDKAGVATPYLLWFVVIVPIALFHALMGVRRVKMGMD